MNRRSIAACGLAALVALGATPVAGAQHAGPRAEVAHQAAVVGRVPPAAGFCPVGQQADRG